MIKRVRDEENANLCDNLLTKLILDEKQYDNTIDENYEVKDYFKNVIKNINNILLCYEENGVVVGYIYLKEVFNENSKGYLIDGLYVEKEFRNRKIATKLIEEGLKIIKNYNTSFIDVNVMANNKTALELYKHFGFSEFRISMRSDI